MTCQEGLRLFTLTVQFQNQESKKIQNKTTLSLWFKENKGKNKHREKFLNCDTFPSICFFIMSFSYILFTLIPFLLLFSPVLSLCGVLAAILALGSHLSFGVTHAFLLDDGTSPHTRACTHSHTQTQ